MNKYHYTAFRKPRGMSKRYVGDGIIEAETKGQAREQIAYRCDYPKNLIKLNLMKKD